MKEVAMLGFERVHGFDVAEAMEPIPRREQIAQVVGLAEYLEPTSSSSQREVDRSVTEISGAANHDDGLLQEAQRLAQRRLAQGECSRRVVSLLGAAQTRPRPRRRCEESAALTGDALEVQR